MSDKKHDIIYKVEDAPLDLQDGDGFKIVMPEISLAAHNTVNEDFRDVYEAQYGKMPLSEVFAKQPAKKRILAIEKAKATKKRRKANKAAKQSRKK